MSSSIKTSSSDNDLLILVDKNDQEIGTLSKLACHMGAGALHRAFSVFIFNRHGELLLQQRSTSKPLWPLYWSNSCCSHPRPSETIARAAQRRTDEELGLHCQTEYLYKFKYQAQYKDIGVEHEVCHVLVSYSDETVKVNQEEVANWRFIAPEELSREIAAGETNFTPWFKLEWQRIKQDYLENILAQCGKT